MIQTRLVVARHLRRLLPIAVASVLSTGCAQRVALHLPGTPEGMRERTSVYDQLGYWPVQEDAADDGMRCVPESLLGTYAAEAQGDRDLWARVRAGYGLGGDVDNGRIDLYIDSFAYRQRLFDHLEARASPYLHYVVGELEKRNMPLEIALLPVIESGYNPNAVSPGRAAGLWQITPGTGARLGLQQSGHYDGRKDVVASTDAALDYLEELHKRFDGDWYLALAAYNTGEGNVQRAIERNRRLGKPTDYWSLPLSAQACNYVPQLIALSRVLESPEQHGVALSALPDSASWVPVEVGARIDLNRVASRAGIDAQELRGVNPAYGRGITPAQSSNSVLVPAEDRDRFVAALAHAPANAPAQRQGERYRVRKGDTLLAIARLHRTSVDALRAINGSNGDELREGQWLLLPDDAVLPRRQFATSETLALKEQGIYTVRAGDTLSGIASRFGVPTAELVALNRIDTRMTLRVGQKLRVRGGNDPAVAVAAGASSTASAQRYTVRAGDSIARIATRFGVRVADLLAWNRIDRSRPLIHPGQILVLHPPKPGARVARTR